jgi:hypothetical protein
MSLSLSVWLVVVFAVVGANLPFINDRWFAVWPRQTTKPLSIRLLHVSHIMQRKLHLSIQ